MTTTRRYDFDRNFEAKQSRRMHAEDRYLTRIARREREAEKMVGTLIRDGREINYIMPIGGKYQEGDFFELVAFLVRNNYV